MGPKDSKNKQYNRTSQNHKGVGGLRNENDTSTILLKGQSKGKHKKVVKHSSWIMQKQNRDQRYQRNYQKKNQLYEESNKFMMMLKIHLASNGLQTLTQ